MAKNNKGRSLQEEFDKWVLSNYTGGVCLPEPPEDWDREKEFFYRMDLSGEALQYRIQIKDVPEKYWA